MSQTLESARHNLPIGMVNISGTNHLSDSHLTRISRQLSDIISQKNEILFRKLFGSTENVLKHLQVKRGLQTPSPSLSFPDRVEFEDLRHVSEWGRNCSMGIDNASVSSRRVQCGENIIHYSQRQSLQYFLYNSVVSNKMIHALIVAALLCFMVDLIDEEKYVYGWKWSLMIFLSMIILVSLQAFNEYARQYAFLSLQEVENQLRPVTVWRYFGIEPTYENPESSVASLSRSTGSHPRMQGEFRAQEIPPSSLVVGDVFRISPGVQLSCDALLLRCNAPIEVDELLISGEGEDQQKDVNSDFFLIAGSSIRETSGEGLAVACAVGMESSRGRDVTFLQGTRRNKKALLQKQLHRFTAQCLAWSALLAAFTFFLLLLKDLFLIHAKGGIRVFLSGIFFNAITALMLVVLAVSEALPLAVTIAVSHAMREIIKEKAVPRSFAACETMGSTTVLCADKTGTLTKPWAHISLIITGLTPFRIPMDEEKNMGKDKLTVAVVESDKEVFRYFPGDYARAVPPRPRPPSSRIVMSFPWNPKTVKLFFNTLAWSSLNPSSGKPINKTAAAVLAIASRISFSSVSPSSEQGSSSSDMKSAMERIIVFPPNCYKRFPLTSREKFGITVVADVERALQHTYLYGGAEIVLSKCSAFLSSAGRVEKFTPATFGAHKKMIEDHSAMGLRLLCFAAASQVLESDWTENSADLTYHHISSSSAHYCLVAILGHEEILEDGVIPSLKRCHLAGIQVVMVSGDAHLTACNVGIRCGLLNVVDTPFATLTGSVFRQLDDAHLLSTYIPCLRVLSRATPADKQRLIYLLQLHDPSAVVGMVGDGSNDVLAVRKSDIGFAMSHGSIAAKNEADIILLDSFSGVVSAIVWGRTIRDNIRKFLQYQLTVNLGGCLGAFFGAVMGEKYFSPLRPVQLLWLNLIINSLAAFALATEPPSREVLLKPPERESSFIVTTSMGIGVAMQTFLQLVIHFLLLFVGLALWQDEQMDAHNRLLSSPSQDVPSTVSEVHVTFIFNAFVWMQIFNFFNARLLELQQPLFEGIRENKQFLCTLASVGLFQIIIIHYGGDILMTVPLTISEWIFSLLIGLTAFPIGSASRWISWKMERRIKHDQWSLWRRDSERKR